MSGNLKLKSNADYSTVGGSSILGDRDLGNERSGSQTLGSSGAASRWKPTLTALITTWVSLSVVTILVFLLGFYLGRQHGVKVALDGQADAAARLPLVPQSVAIRQSATVREAEHLPIPADADKKADIGDLASNAAAPQVVSQPQPGSPIGSPPPSGTARTEQKTGSANVEPSKTGAGQPVTGQLVAGSERQAQKGASILLAEQKIDFTQTASLTPNNSNPAGGGSDGSGATVTGATGVSAASTGNEKGAATDRLAGAKNTVEKNVESTNSAYNTAGFGTKPALSAADLGKSSQSHDSSTVASSREPGAPVKSSLETSAGRTAATGTTARGSLSQSGTLTQPGATGEPTGELTGAKVPAEPKQKDRLTGGWYIQIAAKTDQKEAAALVKRLSASKVSARIEPGVVRGVTYYRVVSGPFKSRDAAAPTLKRVKGSGVTATEPFLKQVK